MGSSRLTRVIPAFCALIGCLLLTSDCQETSDNNRGVSGIEIRISAGPTFEKSTVTATGQLVNIIADSERASFGIGSDAELIRAVGKFFEKEPNDVFLHSPTPWDDLYRRYGWPEVERVLEPKKAEILDINTKPTIVSTRNLENDSSKTVTFSTKIIEEVTNTVSNEWTNSNTVSVEQTIKYSISFLGTGGGGETSAGFEHMWGKSEKRETKTMMRLEDEANVELGPGEAVIAQLLANSGKMRVRITYEAYLRGKTAVNYKREYKGHHFWGLLIGEVLSGSNRVEITEDVEVGYYSNATVNVVDKKTNDKKKFFLGDRPREPASEL